MTHWQECCVPHNSFLLLMMLSYDFKLCRSHLRAVEKHLLNSLVWLLCLPRNGRWYWASVSHHPSPLRSHQYLTILFAAPQTQVLQYDSNRKQLHPNGILTVPTLVKKNNTQLFLDQWLPTELPLSILVLGHMKVVLYSHTSDSFSGVTAWVVSLSLGFGASLCVGQGRVFGGAFT